MKRSTNRSFLNLIVLMAMVFNTLQITTAKASPLHTADACTAFNFTGSQYVTVADPGGTSLPKTTSSSLTIETWVYPTSTSGTKSIVRWGTNTHFYIDSGTLYTEVWSDSNDTTTWKVYHSSAPTTIPANQWTHVAMTWNKDTSTVKLYVNGVDESAVQVNSGTQAAVEAFHIGWSSNYGQGFVGNMDEFRIWNTARSASEIFNNKDQRLVGNESGLVALFHFDDSVITDDAGGDNTGTPTGATLVTGSLVPSATCNVDVTAPTVTTFTATAPSSSLNIPITAFTASDSVGVTGYKITESSTPPLASDSGWTGTAPSTYTVSANGSYTLYPWAKDAEGNVSAVFSSPASVTVSGVFIVSDNLAATLVLGQPGFVTKTQNVTQTGLHSPIDVAVSPTTGKVFVCEDNSHRVLRYASLTSLANGAAAEIVLGQTGFTGSGTGSGLNQFNHCNGIFVDSSDRLWVSDTLNGRILRFDSASTALTGASANGYLGGGLNHPRGLFAEGGRLWVADFLNCRVLRYDNAAGKADNASYDGYLGGGCSASQTTMNFPAFLTVDASGRLWVTEQNNNRVLRFNNAAGKADGAAADGVLGQSLFTTSSSGTTQGSFSSPQGVSIDNVNDRLFVSDQGNQRVLVFNNVSLKSNGANADNVIGQANFTSNGVANPPTDKSLNALFGAFYDPISNGLLVADYNNARVLVYGVTPSHTVTFDSNGGSGSMSSQTANMSTVLTTNAFTRTGYTFNGWNTAANGSGTAYADSASYNFSADVTLYAQWVAQNFTATFNGNSSTGGSMSNQTANSSTALTTNAFTRTGYSFAGWNTTANGNGTSYADGASYNFSADITFYAQWTINQYTVTFNANGGSGSMSNQTGNYNVAANLTSNAFTRTGYTFSGWNTTSNGSGTSYANGDSYPFAVSVTLYVQWTINQYTISFNSNGGTSVSSITDDYSATVSAPTAPTRTGYTFAGWYSDAGLTSAYTFSTMPASNITLYAKWTTGGYTITFEENGGSTISDITDNYGATVSAPTAPTRTGYTFAGWYSDAGLISAYTFSTMPASNTTLYAKWTINQYTVTYDGNTNTGGSVPTDSSSPYNYNSTVTILGNTGSLVKTAYTFTGWNTAANGSGTAYVASGTFTLGAANVTLYAQWSSATQNMTFNSMGRYDGWILESSETSGVGGTMNNTATTFNLGDDLANQQYRAILHFNTSSLPDTAVITSATLKIKKYTQTGSDPFTILGGLKVDMRKPAFGATALALTDFKSAAGKSNVATFGATALSKWYSAVLNSTGNLYINRSGNTQFRLRFTKDDNNDFGNDYVRFYSGNAGTANQPQLVIQYYVP